MRHAASRRPEDELDAWVLEELEAITQSVRVPPPANDARRQRQIHPVESAGELEAAGDPPRLDLPAETMVPLLEDADTAFIERSAEWLHGRANADMILEELWRVVVSQQTEERAVVGAEDAANDVSSGGEQSDHTGDGPEGPGADGD